jgi:hypothetical protein
MAEYFAMRSSFEFEHPFSTENSPVFGGINKLPCFVLLE